MTMRSGDQKENTTKKKKADKNFDFKIPYLFQYNIMKISTKLCERRDR